MEKILEAGVTGVILYLCWHFFLPAIGKKRQGLVNRMENNLEKRGHQKHYKFLHRSLKIFLYILIALLILPFVLMFIFVSR